jgi:hypothetical protein
VGAGLSAEPHALAAAGFAATMLGISPHVVAAMKSAAFIPEAFDRILDASQARAGFAIGREPGAANASGRTAITFMSTG